ncbi:putative uncharacterized protein [Prevotella sp. CAG:255]|uniref:glycosyltransferase family 2 protein n=1 Tax=Prevotella sp. CAG:255 TaxID=1262923 RepID=UPI000338667C|nr:glycosyltransferase family A protein [Prevotella sp. CAG:255]CCX68427.1 putative uncharacterized protein [Prevotella sp. CAG:255]
MNASNILKIIKKSGIGKYLCQLLLPVVHDKIDCSETNIHLSRTLLQSISADPCQSCIRNKPQVSTKQYDLQVIVPAYNTSKYIGTCIDSALNLPISSSLIVTVINDGSTDNTGEILKKYSKDNRVEIITQDNRGFSGARNRALTEIKGRYITFLDSDDEFVGGGNFLDNLIHLADIEGLDIIECGYITFTEEHNIKTFRHANTISNDTSILYGYPWGKLIRANLFEKVQFPEGYWFEDTLMSFIIFPMCQKIATSADILYRYRINPSGISATAKRKSKTIDSYWITEQLLTDRTVLGLKSDEAFYKIMLKQIKINYSRIHSLGRKDVDQAVFILTSNLLNEYFSKYKTESPLSTALSNGNFAQYKLLNDLT